MATSGEITHEMANKAIDDLVRLIEAKLFGAFHIAEIIKGGSLGHGTAVSGHFDVDLVIYSNDVEAEKIKTFGYGYYLKDLHTFLQNALGSDYVQTEKERRLVSTGRSIQFKYKGKIDVDLLVSPNWQSQQDLNVFLSKEWPTADCENYSVFASKWQVQFFKNQPPKVKDFIRKAKMWRNEQWPMEKGGAGKPSSFLMSLLVVKAYEEGGAEGINEALKRIVKGSPDITWQKFYTISTGGGPSLLTLPSPPRIIDPANPVNNVWKTGFKKYKPGERISDYEPGDGNAVPLREKIGTIDLHRPDGMAN